MIKNLPVLFPESTTYFNLNKAFTPKGISLHPIATKWIIDAESVDSRGNTFVALFHHHVYPVYASFAQFEAVYNFYPHNLIDHSRKATRFAFGISKFFTNLAR